MGNETQAKIAERLAIESLTSQISGLGYTTMQSIQGLPCNDSGRSMVEGWLKRVENLGLAFQVYCRGICDQMRAEEAHVDGGFQSAIFQLGAIGDYATEYLTPTQIQIQGGTENQRLFVSQTAIAIQDACDSIAAQIEREIAA